MAPRNIRTDAQLVTEGYFHTITKRCGYHPCEAQIEVWRTPKGKLMPFDRLHLTPKEAATIGLAIGEGAGFIACLEPHFATCKGLAERKQATAEGRHQEPEPEPGQ